MSNESATTTAATVYYNTSINSSAETSLSHEEQYAAGAAAFVDGHVRGNSELYAQIFAASLEVLGLSELSGLNATVVDLDKDFSSAFRFFTFLTLFVVLVGVLQVYNVYCTHKGRRSSKKYYTSLHDGIELPVRTVRAESEDAIQ